MTILWVLRCLSIERIVLCRDCANVVECGLFNSADILEYFVEFLLSRNLTGPSETLLNCRAKLFFNIAREVLSAIVVLDCEISNIEIFNCGEKTILTIRYD